MVHDVNENLHESYQIEDNNIYVNIFSVEHLIIFVLQQIVIPI